jgi:hypothetical protein
LLRPLEDCLGRQELHPPRLGHVTPRHRLQEGRLEFGIFPPETDLLQHDRQDERDERDQDQDGPEPNVTHHGPR